MRYLLSATALALGGCLLADSALAVNGHYVAGVEGLRAATVPPPGTYYRAYLVHYRIDSLTDGRGDDLPGDNDGSVSALVSRLVWISDKRFLGADYGAEAIVPLQRTSLDFDAVGIDDRDSGVGDIFLSPLVLGWHGHRWDAVFAAGEWFDTADYDAGDPATTGKGFRTTMLTLGGTLYFDAAKSWSFSALSRYEINGEQDTTGITPGDSLTVEWGLGKRLASGLEIGLVGYDAWQLERDEDVPSGAPNDKAEQHAIGAEAGYFWPKAGLGLNAAYLNEYTAKDRPQGDMLRLTLTKVL
ncbi:SphA family protein [Modicisalibacter coralii]|uniref:SphA family protein n=1 Tax=Modicisalibacter coralii TaxID=2304602 RepID=UPI00100A2E38|nr:transporter [Halomonas coralii]